MEREVEIESLLGWLAAQTLYPKVYWRDEEDGEIAAIGQSALFQGLPPLDEGMEGRFFGGYDFWGRCKKSLFFRPLIEVERRGERVILKVPPGGAGERLEEERELKWRKRRYQRSDSPTREVWTRHVKGVRHLEKVVLARETALVCAEEVCPWTLLSALPAAECAYGFAAEAGCAFIGNSPELLYRRAGRELRSSALAGTRRRGGGAQEDRALREALRRCPKEQRECSIVKESIERELAPLSYGVTLLEQEVAQTATVQHLHYPLRATLLEGVDDRQLIGALHPTPAVAGFPRKESLEEIALRERFERGWYSAPVGWLSQKGAHLRVGIRSALVKKKSVRLYAGAGILEGSKARYEWQELEDKIAQYMHLFQ